MGQSRKWVKALCPERRKDLEREESLQGERRVSKHGNQLFFEMQFLPYTYT